MKSNTARPFTVARLAAAYSAPATPNRWIVYLGGVEWAACPTYESAKSMAAGFRNARIVEQK